MDSLFFTEEHIMIRDMVREFADSNIVPVARTLDETGEFPKDLVEKMSELGLMGIIVPEQYGGAGLDMVAFATAIMELGRADASVAITMAAHTSLGTLPLLLFGNEDQKNTYLPKLASGETLGAFGLTEPNAGSDAGNTQTRAVLKGDEYVVNGEKAFCTNAGEASVMIFTSVIEEDGEEKGISAFVIDADTEGMSLNPPEKKMGWCGSDTRSVFF